MSFSLLLVSDPCVPVPNCSIIAVDLHSGQIQGFFAPRVSGSSRLDRADPRSPFATRPIRLRVLLEPAFCSPLLFSPQTLLDLRP